MARRHAIRGRRWIGLVIIVLAGVLVAAAGAGKQARASQALKTQLEAATKSGDTAKALQLAERMIDAVEPDHVESLYAAAQLHARLGPRE